jgi:hypothetical protein
MLYKIQPGLIFRLAIFSPIANNALMASESAYTINVPTRYQESDTMIVQNF